MVLTLESSVVFIFFICISQFTSIQFWALDHMHSNIWKWVFIIDCLFKLFDLIHNRNWILKPQIWVNWYNNSLLPIHINSSFDFLEKSSPLCLLWIFFLVRMSWKMIWNERTKSSIFSWCVIMCISHGEKAKTVQMYRSHCSSPLV